ncbi:prolyl 3-hydroxylase 3 isoform X2 [Xenopus laevis]|uniref:procollagen-proline 3-dioxygenase n=1 Tax=Xenopus laevis TaxID=8355 RepID=A0A8J0TEX6_XENLA|nr:prolyl 3-hydroxylase 3 isoform X2 [Xenopus laevis]
MHCAQTCTRGYVLGMCRDVAPPPPSRPVPHPFILSMQKCQLEELNEAAAAAFTFYLRNPHHEQIKDDVQRYRTMKGVSKQSFRDLEEPHHMVLYSRAVSLLSEGKLSNGVWRLEESLALYLSALEECRSLCEGTREQENEEHRDISEVIAEYYIQVLQCKQRCVLEGSLGQKRSRENIIISHLALLEEGYTKLEKWEAAAQITQSLLLFYPHNETILGRLSEYERTLQGRSSTKPRESIAAYVSQSLLEKKLLYYAMENLGISFQDPDLWTPEEIIPESLRETVRLEREAEEQRGADLPYEEVTVTMTPKQMNGTMRVTMDGVISKEECEALLGLAQEAAGSGEGFKDRRSPHTPHERIQSLGVRQALQMASSGSVNSSQAQLFYQTSERARVLAEVYFGTESLHFSYTHLVCRTAIEGKQEGRTDVSQPVHTDNCVLDTEEKKCWREPPAYIHRDFSGLLYLNEDFQGGNLFFTEMDGTTITAELHPSCGRLVLFSSGGENAHGVRAVTGGKQCAIELWFTKSAEHAEQTSSQSKALVRDRDEPQESTEGETTRNRRVSGRSGRETVAAGDATSSDPERPSGRTHQKRAARKFTDEL